ncbi:MAG: hypothetical protein SNJ52_00960 [Verrucomicrobiia bacterium]
MHRTWGDYSKRTPQHQSRRSDIIWAVVLFGLTALSTAIWGVGYFLFTHPEHPLGYSFLTKIGKLDPLKRFQPTEAPVGRFLSANDLVEQFLDLPRPQFDEENARLMRMYLRNYKRERSRIPYVIGRFTIVQVQELDEKTPVPSGIAAMAQSDENPNVFIEHIFPARPEEAQKAMKFLRPGLPLVLQRTIDFSALIHIKRFDDGRLIGTVMPLLYGSYGLGNDDADFACSPPERLLVQHGWPATRKSEEILARFRPAPRPVAQTSSATAPVALPPAIVRPGASPPTAQVRDPALVAATTRTFPPSPNEMIAEQNAPRGPATPSPESRSAAATPQLESTPIAAATPTPEPVATPEIAEVLPPGDPPEPVVVAAQAADQGPPLQPFLSAERPESRGATSPASWQTYQPNEAPPGRFVDIDQLSALAATGLPDEKIYLGGSFVVSATGPNTAVLRRGEGNLQPFFLNGQEVSRARVIVEYPPGSRVPASGSRIERDERRPFEVVDVRRSPDGQVSIRVREIISR